MPTIRLRRIIKPWGRGFGIPLTPDELARLHATEGTPVEVSISTGVQRFDVTKLPKYRWGPRASRDHTSLAGEAALNDLER